MSIFPKGWGDYPPEYNREIHGPYDPSRYYGKPDTPFSQVKLGELGSWLGRRNKNPRAMAQAISRAWMGYRLNWVAVRNPGGKFFYQFCASAILFGFFLDYKRYTLEKKYRYH